MDRLQMWTCLGSKLLHHQLHHLQLEMFGAGVKIISVHFLALKFIITMKFLQQQDSMGTTSSSLEAALLALVLRPALSRITNASGLTSFNMLALE